MKTELKELKEVLSNVNMLGNSDLINKSLTKLSNKIVEVEKRIESVKHTNKDISDILYTYEDIITNKDFGLLERSINDINIAMDLNNTQPITENWYDLFDIEREEKFKPRTVSEYVDTLPREEVKVIYPKGTILFWGKKLETYVAPSGSRARLTADYTTESEYVKVEFLDNCSQGNGGYYRDMFKDEVELPSVPSELCKTPQTYEFVKDIIAKLKVIDVDGETMQYIIEQVGMNDQMLRQLIMSNPHTDTTDILEEKVRLSDASLDAMSLNKKTRGCIEI